jgi:F0F1-type ATP synthase delta subunit
MMLAALPNRAMKRMIVEWFRREVHPQLLLTFSARGDIGGGFILRAGSKQYDFSFRGKILSNKQRIVEIFDSVRQ